MGQYIIVVRILDGNKSKVLYQNYEYFDKE